MFKARAGLDLVIDGRARLGARCCLMSVWEGWENSTPSDGGGTGFGGGDACLASCLERWPPEQEKWS